MTVDISGLPGKELNKMTVDIYFLFFMFHGHTPLIDCILWTFFPCSLCSVDILLLAQCLMLCTKMLEQVALLLRSIDAPLSGCSFAALHRRSALVTLVLVSLWCSALSVRLRALKDCCIILAVSACVK